MTDEGERVPDDVAQLQAEFPAWDFRVAWQAAGSGPDGRQLLGWSLDGGPQLVAADADGMRRAIREAAR